MAPESNRAVLLSAGLVSGLTLRTSVVPPADLNAYRSVMSRRWLALVVGASRWSAALTRSVPAPMDATSPARARSPTDVAARRYGFIRSGRPPLGCCWTMGVGMDRSAGSTSLLRLRAVRRSLPGACDVFATRRPMDDRAGRAGRSATLGA